MFALYFEDEKSAFYHEDRNTKELVRIARKNGLKLYSVSDIRYLPLHAQMLRVADQFLTGQDIQSGLALLGHKEFHRSISKLFSFMYNHENNQQCRVCGELQMMCKCE